MTSDDSNPEQSVVWTFQIVGGDPFSVQPKEGPVLEHNGVMSVWNISLRRSQAEQLQQIALHHGARVPLFHAEVDRTGQGLRDAHLELQGEDYPFPTPKCPGCFWFDPLTDTGCGYVDWPEEMKEVPISKAWEDLDNCPGFGR